MLDIISYAASRQYTDESMEGGGAVAGKNCTIDSIVDITGGHRVTFKWTLDNGTVKTGTMDVMDGQDGQDGQDGHDGADGKGIKSVAVNEESHLIITYTDDTTSDAGAIAVQSAVDSVNGKTGDVTLTASDVGALPDDTPIPDISTKQNIILSSIMTIGGQTVNKVEEALTALNTIKADKSELSGFITKTVDDLVNYYKKTETYNKTEIDNIVTAIKNSRFEVVSTLPTTDIQTNVIYLVPKASAQTNNIKDEYINLDGTTAGWEKIGDTEIDLSGYVTTTALNTALANYTTTTDLTTLLAVKQPVILASALPIGGIQRTTVEEALGALNTAKQGKTLDTPVTIDGAQETTVEGAIGALNDYVDSIDLSGYEKLIPKNAGARNSAFGGRSLGAAVTAEQFAAIAAGTFDGLLLGDYWTIDGVNYRIAAFDYWLHCGNTECTDHHVLIVPDSNLYTAKMNDSDVTTGGYVGSKMRTTNLDTAKATINAAFGSAHILSHKELLTKTVTDGKASGWDWYDSTVELMNEAMVYGHSAWGSSPAYETGIDKGQLPLFAAQPDLICNRAYWWLRDVVSAPTFALVADTGDANHHGASAAHGVRPAFAIY